MKTIARVAVPGPKEVEAIWLDRVRRWKKSGMTAKNFAEQERVAIHQLHGWSGRFRKAGADVFGQPVHVSAVSIVPALQSSLLSACIEIAVGGALIVVRAGFDAALLRQVVAALEHRA